MLVAFYKLFSTKMFIYNIEGELNESYDNTYSFSLHAPSIKIRCVINNYGACKKQTLNYSQSIPLHHCRAP